MDLVIPKAVTSYTFNIPEEEEATLWSDLPWVAGDEAYRVETHRVYKAIADIVTTATPPEDNLTEWQDIRATNAYRAIDDFINTQTIATATDLVVTFDWFKSDAIFLDAVNANSVIIEVFDNLIDLNLLYTNTIELKQRKTTGWHSFWFKPFETTTNLIDSPLFTGGSSMRLTFEGGGGDTAVGLIVFGQLRDIGATQFGSDTGIIDFSDKTENEFGDISLEQGAFRNRGSFNVIIDTQRMNSTNEILKARRGLATLYIGAREYANTFIYGFFKDYNIINTNARKSEYSLQVESLT